MPWLSAGDARRNTDGVARRGARRTLWQWQLWPQSDSAGAESVISNDFSRRRVVSGSRRLRGVQRYRPMLVTWRRGSPKRGLTNDSAPASHHAAWLAEEKPRGINCRPRFPPPKSTEMTLCGCILRTAQLASAPFLLARAGDRNPCSCIENLNSSGRSTNVRVAAAPSWRWPRSPRVAFAKDELLKAKALLCATQHEAISSA